MYFAWATLSLLMKMCAARWRKVVVSIAGCARGSLIWRIAAEYIIGIWCVCVILILMWPFRSYIFVRLPSGRAQSVIKFGCMAARYERAGCVDLLGALSSHLYAENKINCFCYASWKMYTPSECVCVCVLRCLLGYEILRDTTQYV